MRKILLPEERLYKELNIKACNSRRKRELILLRSSDSPDKIPAIMINSFQPGTYVTPHRHPADGREFFCILSGQLKVIIFDEFGKIANVYRVSPNSTPMMEIPGRTYHTVIAELPDSLIIELYFGIYKPETYKQFSKWAPQESQKDFFKNKEYLQSLLDKVNSFEHNLKS